MTTRARSLLVVVLIVAVIHAPTVQAALPSSGAAKQSRHGSNVYQRLASDDGRNTVQVLTGREALDHLKNLQARRPGPFAEAGQRLRAKGWTPTEHVLVVRTVRKAITSRNGYGPILPAQTTTIDTDEGEVVFWSWDDGDPLTWEGEMWAQRYSDGAEALTAPQADTEQHYVTSEELIYWHSPTVENPVGRHDTGGSRTPMIQRAKWSGNSAGPILLTQERRKPVDARQFVKDYLSCVLVSCGGGLVGCMFSGPLYIECITLNCAAFITLCALGEIIKRL